MKRVGLDAGSALLLRSYEILQTQLFPSRGFAVTQSGVNVSGLYGLVMTGAYTSPMPLTPPILTLPLFRSRFSMR